jgi:hypothetical protein
MGYTKNLRTIRTPVRLADPDTGEPIDITLVFRRLDAGASDRWQALATEREAEGRDFSGDDIAHLLAPVFVSADGIDDFPEEASPAESFLAYFSSEGKTDEEAEALRATEHVILQVVFMEYQSRFFRLYPQSLVAETLRARREGDARVGGVAPGEPLAGEVQLPEVSAPLPGAGTGGDVSDVPARRDARGGV